MIAETSFDENTTTILNPLFDHTFPEWLKQYSRILSEYKRVQRVNREDDEHYDIMLEIFATCLRARQNANNFIREGMQHSVREIVKYTRVENRRYRPILKIMERIISYCEESKRKEIADFFMDGSDSSVFYVQILEQVIDAKLYATYK